MSFRYEFTNIIDDRYYVHYIKTDEKLTAEEQKEIGKLLASFPHANRKEWPKAFATLNVDSIPKKLVILAANAYDSIGNTVLGVVAEHGAHIDAAQLLIDMGALLDTPDHNLNKLALHWAISNKLSCSDKKSEDAAKMVKWLLDNGARTDITCYQNCTPLDYAKQRDFTAAAELIEQHNKKVIPKKHKEAPLFLDRSMEILARNGDVDAIKELMSKGVEERPILIFHGIHESHFQGIDLLELESFKEKIINNPVDATPKDQFGLFAQNNKDKKKAIITSEQRRAASLFWTQLLTGEGKMNEDFDKELPSSALMQRQYLRKIVFDKLQKKNSSWPSQFREELDSLINQHSHEEDLVLIVDYETQGILSEAVSKCGIPEVGLFPSNVAMSFDNENNLIINGKKYAAKEILDSAASDTLVIKPRL